VRDEQLAGHLRPGQLSHDRDHNKNEVDAIIENRHHQVIGIEVKAAPTIRSDDFNGLRRLAERLGDDFLLGLVLYTGTTTLPFGPKLRATPISALWRQCQRPSAAVSHNADGLLTPVRA
jgi:hypothetical protein